MGRQTMRSLGSYVVRICRPAHAGVGQKMAEQISLGHIVRAGVRTLNPKSADRPTRGMQHFMKHVKAVVFNRGTPTGTCEGGARLQLAEGGATSCSSRLSPLKRTVMELPGHTPCPQPGTAGCSSLQSRPLALSSAALSVCAVTLWRRASCQAGARWMSETFPEGPSAAWQVMLCLPHLSA